MNELGGPITKSKPKEEIDPKLKASLVVKSISETLVRDKLKFQDIPMLIILVLHFLSHINVLSSFDMIVMSV
jgi:hypothetical protein